MKNIKILIIEPRHHTIEVHSSYIPVGIGYISAYMIKMTRMKNPNVNIDLKISKDRIVLINFSGTTKTTSLINFDRINGANV